MRCFLERLAQGLVLAALLVVPLSLPPKAMAPLSAAIIYQTVSLEYYKNFPEHTYSFDGFLSCGSSGNPNLVGSCFPNGQGLMHIPGLNLGQCLLQTAKSWGQMIGLLYLNGGPPYGPTQSEGGCSDESDNPPQSNSGSLASCSSPYNGGKNFAGTYVNPLVASMLTRAGGTCGACVQGPTWYPCQAGLIGCSNPPAPGSCTPARFSSDN
jgi:hypothetical protein